MSLTRILRFSTLIIFMAFPLVSSAQVPVEVSGEKIVSGGRVYYLHEVQKSQTLYSISKAYKVAIDAITRENVIPPNGIQTGQMLRIPAPDQQAATTTLPRPAGASGTSRQQPVSQPSRQAIVSDVPGISISGEKIVSGGKTYYMHQVLKGQTLYSIAKAYRVTILDIDRENSIPAGGLQAGQVLKIPASSALTVIEVQDLPMDNAAKPGRAATSAAGTEGGTATRTTAMPRQETPAQATQMPRQETPRQDTQLPRQETPGQVTQMPRQEQPAAKTEAVKPENEGAVTFRTAETKENAETKTQPETKVQQETKPQQEAQTPASSEEKPKPVLPEKKKIHKVQKGESLADIAKKYGISVQELKQANKGVIFAMPDMRLVIPVKDENQPDGN